MSDEVVELRVDGYTLISHIEVNEKLKCVYIPTFAHPWGVDMMFGYKDLDFLVDKLLSLYGGNRHMVNDYVSLKRPNLTNLYFHRVPSYSHV